MFILLTRERLLRIKRCTLKPSKMAPSVSVQKVSEEYRDYILTTGYICTLTNYLEYLKSTRRRQVTEHQIVVSDGIIGVLKVYPTGISNKFDGCISIYTGARWKKSKSIVIKFDTAILDSNGKRLLLNSSENFERVPAMSLIGDPQVMHSDLCYDKKHKFLSDGCLTILINITVNIEMMIYPEMLDRFEMEYRNLEAELRQLLEDPAFGDTVLVISGKKYYVERDVLIKGNPLFIEFFAKEKHINGCFQVRHPYPEVMDHIIIDCYLNGNEDDFNLSDGDLKDQHKKVRSLSILSNNKC